MCEKCRKEEENDPRAVEKFYAEYPDVKAFHENQKDQERRNGKTFVFNPTRAVEAWNRVTKGLPIEDRDTLANTISTLMNLRDILNDPGKLMKHVIEKGMQEGSVTARAMLFNPATGETTPLGSFSGGPEVESSLGDKLKRMEKSDIDKLFNDMTEGKITGRGGNA